MNIGMIFERLVSAQSALNEKHSWFDFVSKVDDVLEALELLEHQQGNLLEAAKALNNILLARWKYLAWKESGMLLAECYGMCKNPEALGLGIPTLREIWARELQQENRGENNPPENSVALGYLASLARLDQEFPGRESSQQFGRLLEELAEASEARTSPLSSFRLKVDIVRSILTSHSNGGKPPSAASGLFATRVPHPGFSKLKVGDCVFRDLNVLGLRDLGHVGIYFGCPAHSWIDVNNWDEHQVIEVTTKGCEINSIPQFTSHGTFWGYYAVNLVDSQRDKLLGVAMSFVGISKYARIGNYKNAAGREFRCDGFVEYCHETVGVAPPLPNHRGGGLFEDDSWRTLTPSAMRNCFADRYI